MSRAAKRPVREYGYTLLEVVVALTLLSILAVVLGGSLSFGTRVWEHTSRSVRASGDTVSAYQFLDLTFGHVKLGRRDVSSSESEERPPLLGTSSSVVFLVSDMANVGLSGLHRVKISLAGSSLMAVVDPRDDAAGSSAGEENRFVLLDGVNELSLTYRGYGNERHDTGWVSDWEMLQAVPLLVRLDAKRAVGQNIEWVFRLPEPIH